MDRKVTIIRSKEELEGCNTGQVVRKESSENIGVFAGMKQVQGSCCGGEHTWSYHVPIIVSFDGAGQIIEEGVHSLVRSARRDMITGMSFTEVIHEEDGRYSWYKLLLKKLS